MPSYYDIDAILAEEELVPCTTLWNCSFLSHLDPELDENQHYLPENSRIKIPLWVVEKWAGLGCVRLSLPRHFNRKTRERIEAEPSEVDLRKRNERYFISGHMMVNWIEKSSHIIANEIAQQSGGRSARRNSQIAALEAAVKEASELRKTLLSAYTGDRLRHTMDWSLSSVGDDVTAYTIRLTEMEMRLFRCGAQSAAGHTRWKLIGNRRLVPHHLTAKNDRVKERNGTAEHRDKRQRTV